MIEKIVIKNYKKFRDLTLPLNADLNIIVGDNESGKSTLLECINLALNFKINGRFAGGELNTFLFHKPTIDDYVAKVNDGAPPAMPEILVELYLRNDPDLSRLMGSNNSLRENVPGLKVVIRFNDSFAQEYAALLSRPEDINSVPIEYYEAKWFSFADQEITARSVPLQSVVLDATSIRLQNGADSYIKSVINESLDAKQKAGLALAFRGLKESFLDAPAIKEINNTLLLRKGDVTSKDFEVSLDVSQKNTWDSHLVPYLDKIPLYYSGMGEQNSIKLLLSLNRDGDESSIVLVEEIENHLSFSTMAQLLKRIREKCEEKQLIITTHSAYVLNKLGLHHLILLGGGDNFMRLSDLDDGTRQYFEKLPGYDTLRMILSRKSILVEGPSDELVVQRAYMDAHAGHLPIEDGIDVICVRGLSFKRFLDIAKILRTHTSVVTDNDGDYTKKIAQKYQDYDGQAGISIFASTNNSLITLEPQLAAVNDIATLNTVLGHSFESMEQLVEYMADNDNKTDCALMIFSSDLKINYPDYIVRAVS